MKRLVLLVALSIGVVPCSPAVEIRRWERLPLTIPLVVGQERVIFVDRNMRVGMPDALRERLRVQSAGGAIYLRASEPIEPTRLQLQDAETGALILLDIAAQPATPDQSPLEPIRLIQAEQIPSGDPSDEDGPAEHSRATPLAVVLTRYAAQSLYAPLRTVEPVSDVTPVPLRPPALDTLLPTVPVRSRAIAAWRLHDHWVTAILLTNTAQSWLDLDPRTLQGNFLAATFQHPNLGPAGDSTDTTVLYVVTQGHGLAEALLPAISPIDAATHLPAPSVAMERADEE